MLCRKSCRKLDFVSHDCGKNKKLKNVLNCLFLKRSLVFWESQFQIFFIFRLLFSDFLVIVTNIFEIGNENCRSAVSHCQAGCWKHSHHSYSVHGTLIILCTILRLFLLSK